MNYKRKLDFQEKLIKRQSEQIEVLKKQIEELKLECDEKDTIISSITPLREELSQNIAEIKAYKNEYRELIEELKKMKDIMNQTVYRNRWKLIRFLMKN